MATMYNMHEARTQLSRLVERAAGGEEIVIARNGTPVARLMSVPERRPRQLGLGNGLIRERTSTTRFQTTCRLHSKGGAPENCCLTAVGRYNVEVLEVTRV